MSNSSNDAKKRMAELDGWELKDGKIVKNFTFNSFMEGIQFVNDIAEVAEKQNHHPIITIEWKTVKVSSISFDVGHLTNRDFRLASEVDRLYIEEYGGDISPLEDLQDEHRLLGEEEKKEKARKRDRGPYRKSSSAGLR